MRNLSTVGSFRSRRPRVESLEDRRLLVATISVTAETPVAIAEDPAKRIVYSMTRDETDDILTVKFQLSGDAVYDVDYTAREVENDTIFFPEDPPASGPVTATATFYPGESTVELSVKPIRDSLIERDEDVVVTIVSADEFGPVYGAAAHFVTRQQTDYYVVDDENRLATVDIETGCVHVLGTIDATQTITDIAFTDDDDLIAITADRLYQVHPDQVDAGVIAATFINLHGIPSANALIDSRDGDFGSESGDLFAVGARSLDLKLLDLETSDDLLVLQSVTTVFEIDTALAARLLPSDYQSSGDLDYLSSGNLILSAHRPSESFDSLIEIRTPGTAGTIENAPKPAQDPGEDFIDVYGLALDGNDSYAFAAHTLLSVSQFSRDVSRELEMTGRPYLVGAMSSATGTIIGDPADPPVITLNTRRSNPGDLAHGTQPTSWIRQRSQLRDIVIEIGESIASLPPDGIVLRNLGVTGFETPVDIALRSDQVIFVPNSTTITIQLDEGQLPDGRYRLILSPAVTSGPQFTWTGDRLNRFFVLKGDWNGNARVDLLDFATFAYWFGHTTSVAPEYVDLDDSGIVDVGDFAPFENQYADLVSLPGAPDPITPDKIDKAELQRALHSVLNRLDVNGSTKVSPLDALNVLNRLASGFPTATDWRFDVNRDGNITPRDALHVLNYLALQSPPPPASQSSASPARSSAVTSSVAVPSSMVNQDDDEDRLRLETVDEWFAALGGVPTVG
ncbi:dockerin type I domain-containing protein [Stieleria neptunia]|nr:dockerin type I domain-containing protein [Stieleria neptunia]